MKKVMIFILLTSISLFSQINPENFQLDNKLRKSNSPTSTPLSNSINEIVIVNDTIWIGTSKGLSFTDNNGVNWNHFYQSEVFGTESIISIEENNGIIFVSTGHNESDPTTGESVITGSGIKITNDGGQTWISHPQSVDEPGDSLIVYGINTLRILPVTVEQQNVTYDMAVLDGYLYTTSWAGNLRRTLISDLLEKPEVTWERIVLPPDYLDEILPDEEYSFTIQAVSGSFGREANNNHVAFSIVATDSNHLFVGTANGINKSEDGGKSWKKFNHQNQDSAISGNFITALAYDNTTETIWASTWQAVATSEDYAVSFSVNGGNSWKIILEDEKPHGFGFKKYFSGSEQISDVFVATSNNLFRSEDQGLSWTTPNSIYDEYKSIEIDNESFYSVASEDFGNGEFNIWVGTSGGLAKLTETTAWNGIWEIFFASTALKNSISSYAFPNPFNPNYDIVRIKYFVEKETQQITIRIYDFNMQLVRNLVQNVERNKGERMENWDGKDDSGELLPNGVYFYKINIDENDALFGKIMVIK